MEIRCPKCGHKFDPMGEVLVDCPCCEHLFDARTVSPESQGASPRDPNERGRGADEAFSVKDLRSDSGAQPHSAHSEDAWQEPALDDSEYWAARQHKDVQDAINYSASDNWRRMLKRDKERQAGHVPGMFTFLAGLFFPGAGHFRLRRPARGAFFFLLVIVAGAVVFFAFPLDDHPEFTGRGYHDVPTTNIYAIAALKLSSKIRYTIFAVGIAHILSLIDLIVLINIGPRPTPIR
ncbi:MAG: hypothetical protein JW759_03585 [Candidatus Coatesbacteria bacterium]|nr:hypothetical protein [Candidatus Coatesbacteria bacterium]